jgi:hypothetical protein
MNNEYNADSSDDFDNEYVYSEEFVEDLKFRSIKVDQQGGDFFYQPASHVDFGQAFAKSAVKSSSGSGSDCPSVPFGIARTNFPVENLDYGSVVQAIHDTLVAQVDHDFSFVDHEHMVRPPPRAKCENAHINLDLFSRILTILSAICAFLAPL